MNREQDIEMVIALEKAALEQWAKGDPSGFIELIADEVTYFDPFQERRIDGKAGLIKLYESIRGTFMIEKYELIHPRVQLYGDVAILSFNYEGIENSKLAKWNSTEVYHRTPEGWKIVHTHWSMVKPLE